MRQAKVAMTVAATAVMLASGCGTPSTSTPAQTSASTASPSPIPLGAAKLISAGTLSVGTDVPYAPQEFYGANGQLQGFDVDVANAIAGHLGLTTHFVNHDFNTMIQALNGGQFDVVVSAMTITSDRSAQVTFIPYFSAGTAIVVTSSSSFKPTQLSQLCGHKVAAESGTTEVSELQSLTCPAASPITLQQFTTDTEAQQALKQDTVVAYYTDSPVAEYAASQSAGALVVSSPVLEIAPEGVGVAKSNTALATAITLAFKATQADGEYAQLLKKWGLQAGDIGAAPSGG